MSVVFIGLICLREAEEEQIEVESELVDEVVQHDDVGWCTVREVVISTRVEVLTAPIHAIKRMVVVGLLVAGPLRMVPVSLLSDVNVAALSSRILICGRVH